MHQLRYLASVAAEGSIRGAARALALSQATVTQGLRELEAQAGVPLLQRHASGIVFTAAGRELLQHAQQLLAQLRQAEDTLARHRLQGAPQRLAIAVTPWVAATLLPRLLPALRAELPQVQLEIFDGLSALAYPKLRDGSLDLMVGRLASEELLRGLQALPLFRYDMAVVARRGHPQAAARSIAELTDSDWVLNHGADEGAALMHQLFGRHGVAPPPAHRIQLAHSPALIMALVRRSDMLSYCPWPVLESDEYGQAAVQALPLREPLGSNVVGIVRRAQEAPSHAAARFIAVFLAQIPLWAASRVPELRRVMRSVDVLTAG